jgi:hypothetical protein
MTAQQANNKTKALEALAVQRAKEEGGMIATEEALEVAHHCSVMILFQFVRTKGSSKSAACSSVTKTPR